MPPLISNPSLLDVYPGGPFDVDIVDAAGQSVRDDAGWHIAPVVTETVLVDGAYSPFLHLPTLKLVSVASVEVIDDDGVWAARTGWRDAGSGLLYHADRWLYGPAGVRVTMSHGFADCPQSLLPVVAARCQRALVDAAVTQRSETAGQRTSTESYNINRLEIEAGASGLERYTLTGRVV